MEHTEPVSAIREKFRTDDADTLNRLIAQYSADPRRSVSLLAASAVKRLKALSAERERMDKMFVYERMYPDCEYICGIDEVGRGPLAGPVMAAAVILPKDCGLLYLNDSKKLTGRKREQLSEAIRECAVDFAFGTADNERIDEINILQATYEAMRMAIQKLKRRPDILLNDALIIPGVDIPQVKIIHGDALSASIAAASIVAKVKRDALMASLSYEYPGYGFEKNAGYGTAAHMEAIRRLGPCPIHRRTFLKNI